MIGCAVMLAHRYVLELVAAMRPIRASGGFGQSKSQHHFVVYPRSQPAAYNQHCPSRNFDVRGVVFFSLAYSTRIFFFIVHPLGPSTSAFITLFSPHLY
jgi:hypothetical protein